MKLFAQREESRYGENRRRTISPEAATTAVTTAAPSEGRFARLRLKLLRAVGQDIGLYPKTIGGADGVLLAVLVALVAFGVVMVYSASAVLAYRNFDNGQYYLMRQGIFALVAVPMMVVLARVDYHRLRPLTYWVFIVALGLLLVTALGHGKSAGGAARWIRVGSVHVQPAEIMKVAMIFWLSHTLSKNAERVRTFAVGFLPHMLMCGFMVMLCLMQPDFGSAVMIALITVVLLFTAGARVGYLIIAGLIATPAVIYAVASKEYRMRRILAYLDPFAHQSNEGYQVAESLMSFGAGGVTGVGIGDSRQKLFFLPEAHTDFISAIVAEELGLLGLTCLVVAYIVIVHRGVLAAYRAADDYGTFLAIGISLFVGMQAFTNLAVAVGLLPTKGLVLPFMSYGGSSLLVNCAAMGVLLNVSRPREITGAPPREAAVDAGVKKQSARKSNRLVQAGGVA
jgi:cell division protein FtsW